MFKTYGLGFEVLQAKGAFQILPAWPQPCPLQADEVTEHGLHVNPHTTFIRIIFSINMSTITIQLTCNIIILTLNPKPSKP